MTAEFPPNIEDKDVIAPTARTAEGETQELSDEDAENVLLALVGKCNYCNADPMPTVTGCDGCRPIRTMRMAEKSYNLSEFLCRKINFESLIGVTCWEARYGSQNCEDFAEHIGEHLDATRFAQITNGAALTAEEEDMFALWQQKIGEDGLFETLEVGRFVNESGKELYFIFDQSNGGAVMERVSATGPFPTLDAVINRMAERMGSWVDWATFETENQVLGDQIAERLLELIPGGAKW
jgi:hypothetical protein